jgi:hypothetical protein
VEQGGDLSSYKRRQFFGLEYLTSPRYHCGYCMFACNHRRFVSQKSFQRGDPVISPHRSSWPRLEQEKHGELGLGAIWNLSMVGMHRILPGDETNCDWQAISTTLSLSRAARDVKRRGRGGLQSSLRLAWSMGIGARVRKGCVIPWRCIWWLLNMTTYSKDSKEGFTNCDAAGSSAHSPNSLQQL